MKSLDTAVNLVLRWTADKQVQRERVVSLLDGAVADCEAATNVWQSYVDAPGAPGDRWTIVSWIGPDRAKHLHDINLRAKAKLGEICALAGPEASRYFYLDDDLVELAYRMLREGESGIDAAKTAVETLGRRIQYLHGLIQRIRSSKPVAPRAVTSGKSRTGAKKKKGTGKKLRAKGTRPQKTAPAKRKKKRKAKRR